MNPQTTVFYSICISLCALCFCSKPAQAGYLDDADSLLAKGDFIGALVSCERAMYFGNVPENKAMACLKQVEVYKIMGDYESAKKTAQSFMAPFGLDNNLKQEIRFQAALCAHLAGNYDDAKLLLLFLNADASPPDFQAKTYLLWSLNELEKGEMENSKQWLHRYVNVLPVGKQKKDTLHKEVDNLFSKKNRPKLKDVDVAFWWGLVPGLGHVYAGNLKEGLVAFSLNLASLAFGVHQVYYGYYLTGYFGGASLLVKFYYGSHDRKDYLVEQKNYIEVNEFKEKLTKVVGTKE
jgi:hypothetical protein